VLAADADLEIGRVPRPFDAHPHQAADADPVEHLERIVLEDLLLE
jgi:hypothetical protein